jgi:CHASE3 domain sensor protein
MASIGNILVFLGVCSLVGTYVSIVLWAMRESERGTEKIAPKSARARSRQETHDFGHGATAATH